MLKNRSRLILDEERTDRGVIMSLVSRWGCIERGVIFAVFFIVGLTEGRLIGVMWINATSTQRPRDCMRC